MERYILKSYSATSDFYVPILPKNSSKSSHYTLTWTLRVLASKPERTHERKHFYIWTSQLSECNERVSQRTASIFTLSWLWTRKDACLRGQKRTRKNAESWQLHEVIQESSSNRQCVICNYQMHAQIELDVHTQSTIKTTSPCSLPGITALHWTFLGTDRCINKKLPMSVQTYLQKH